MASFISFPTHFIGLGLTGDDFIRTNHYKNIIRLGFETSII